jgi:heat-inducible transcriptional repressor
MLDSGIRLISSNVVPESSRKPLAPRANALLKALVDRYVEEGQPVGSKALAEDYVRITGSTVSPATIRNVMADLEQLGLVSSPHTSAGRVPTQQGFRMFVDTLISVKPLADSVSSLQQQMCSATDDKSLVKNASTILSDFTLMAGMVTVPKRNVSKLRQIEFLPLSDKRVLVVLVTNDSDVQNRVIEVNRDYSCDELRIASNYINAECGGKSIPDVRVMFVEQMRQSQSDVNQVMSSMVWVAEQAISAADNSSPVVVTGENRLMDFDEFGHVDKMRQLFEVFNHKRELVQLLDQCAAADGVQIFIGQESGYEMLDECSVVTAPYVVDGQVVGVLGVVGPTRMAYDRVIPIVDATARLLGTALEH